MGRRKRTPAAAAPKIDAPSPAQKPSIDASQGSAPAAPIDAPIAQPDEAAAAAARKAAEEALAKLTAGQPERPARSLGPAVDAASIDAMKLDGDDLAEMLEFCITGLFMILPDGIGGGELSEREGRMLGRAWTRALAHRLTGENVLLGLAIVGTIETLTKRAIAHRAKRAIAEAVHDGT